MVWYIQIYVVYPPHQLTRKVRAAPFACCQIVNIHSMAGTHARTTEWSWANRVTVLRFWTVASQTPHLTVCTIHHLYKLAHPKQKAKKLS